MKAAGCSSSSSETGIIWALLTSVTAARGQSGLTSHVYVHADAAANGEKCSQRKTLRSALMEQSLASVKMYGRILDKMKENSAEECNDSALLFPKENEHKGPYLISNDPHHDQASNALAKRLHGVLKSKL